MSRDNTLCIFIMLEFSTVAQSIMPGKHIVNAFQMDEKAEWESDDNTRLSSLTICFWQGIHLVFGMQ